LIPRLKRANELAASTARRDHFTKKQKAEIIPKLGKWKAAYFLSAFSILVTLTSLTG
jgi:hypothetical protein